jgi:hypothetical protein
MKPAFSLTACAAATLSLLAAGSATAQTPVAQDRVFTTAPLSPFGIPVLEPYNVVIDARSGPSGEQPSGEASFDLLPGSNPTAPFHFSGAVTCLAVTGHTAVLVATVPATPAPAHLFIQVTDRGPAGSGLDTYDAGIVLPGQPSPPCTPAPRERLTAQVGDVVVQDAPPLPRSKDQCRNDGWRQYSVFKNQGDCVSFVVTGGRNGPATPPA